MRYPLLPFSRTVFYSAGYANDHCYTFIGALWYIIYIYIYNQTDISIWFFIRMNKMTFMDKPLPFSIDDILKYEKSKSTIYPSIIPRSYPLPSLLSSTYLSFSTAHKHSCSGNWFQRNEIVKIFFPCRTSINTMQFKFT